MTAPQEPLKPAFRRASDELPDSGRDVILRSANGGMRPAARLPLEVMRQIYESHANNPNSKLFDGDAAPNWWVNESGYLAPVTGDDEWVYDEDYAASPEDVLEGVARALLSASGTIRELATGVLERRSGLDRAARLSLIRSTDFMAHVAALVLDGHVSEEVAARFKRNTPDFDLDLEELVGLQDMRDTMSALIGSGRVSPFANMDEPPPARDDAAELRAAVREYRHARDWYRYAWGTPDENGAHGRLAAADEALHRLAATEGES